MNLNRLDPELLQLNLVGDKERGYDFVDDALVLELKRLRPDHGMLSVYLDITPEALTSNPPMTRYKQGIAAIRERHADDWSHEQKTTFELVARDLGERLEKMLISPRGRGLALFAAPARVLPKKEKVDYAVFRSFHLPHPPADRIEWGDAPVLAPLLVARDESPRTGVVLFDREKLLLFLAFMGEVAAYDLVLRNDNKVSLSKSHSWHGYGEHNHHQWQEEHYRRYLRQAALAVAKLARIGDWKWLVLASPDHQEAEHLREQLPEPWREQVIGTVALAMDADLNQVRDAVLPVIAEAERQEERQILERWQGEVERPGGRGVAGLADTLLAVEEYRVQTLVVDEGFTNKGWQCEDCGGLVADLAGEPPAECPWCGSEALRELPDIVGEMAVLVMASGGEVEIVHDPDNRKIIGEHGRIGGILRF